MADEHAQEGGIPSTVVFVVGLLLVLGALWWMRGGPNQQPNTAPADQTPSTTVDASVSN